MTITVAGRRCTSTSVDSRTLQPGAVFVALRGPNHDGHDYVAAAFAKGAAAAVVERPVEGCGPLEIVPSALEWLQRSAARVRQAWPGLAVGITGSAGKTTTKEAVAAVLATRLRTGKTLGNYNNHIGVPLTILNLPDDAEAAVIEIGMNHAGEIRQLAAIARPQIGVVTNVGTAHIENLGSVEAIAAAKRELVESLPADGIAVLNGDDERVRAMAAHGPGRTVFYGSSSFVPSEAPHVRATKVGYLAEGVGFEVPDVGSFFCPLPGRAGLMAALAALAVARALDWDLRELKETVARLTTVPMRLERVERNGIVIWNDCYNSNPEAAMMMLDLLAETPARRRIAVLGEMLELGGWSERLHREVGRHAARRVDLLVGVQGAARHLVDEAVAAGLPQEAAAYFDNPREAGLFVRRLAAAGDAVLFKGSRGVHMERAMEAFLE
ncbi:MAG: UDP-N-acetylmuramoyl-tripeptide--D-alanyl-D-alanine ligase [Bryobacteraceae bacterium]|nr:MAG: UDP-N-acetylmuramoyl-tripeptide--D-alanyl-D-alanine ligase [Bryobacteraceae bacterium]